ncbi:MAG TPA: lipid-A-disaccharide synthase N-terminal domain-containing protein [Xanthobacteraceae bacterium]|nr:lipid-A-disaccharide synthase N-terminal domain-containing protein [Xanthobacteraceae bacterium]
MLVDLSQAVGNYFGDVFHKLTWIVLLGYAGQILFTMRFVVQWIASERAGRSVIPLAFWFFSIGGGLLLFGYALYIRDPVFILGQGFGVFVYMRNLYFIRRDKSGAAVA